MASTKITLFLAMVLLLIVCMAQGMELVQPNGKQFGAQAEWKRYMREPLRFGKRFADNGNGYLQFGGSPGGGGGGLINPFLYEAYRSGGPFQQKK